ncbi:MAG: indole-3-glycerol phosphate synthase TrpC [Deltaproteobacteria bacterium]|nr:indole-3-glycerol phosphate synthase TrpC [Deltaproteobacteria bacterium]MBW2051231.1 indole-3-glycerol phosphate synthase TrpC [Deltaproteobacteria bacterium]MBW2141098.1 indole-3-glycerol phosphate synthase TrpC [Deltaproteobacteria bacterium]MBW2322976.1 indole-3-glycerol phosphate synthase TrpC [Deltaproteobacteria bacterium]
MILDRIVEAKQKEVARLVRELSEAQLINLIHKAGPRRSLSQALAQGIGPRIIAEVKRASPSEGPIDPDVKADQVALSYQNGGAAAISVLTDTPFFQGCFADLEQVKAAVKLPVLSKDFFIHEIQVWLAAASGADAILLIAGLLDLARLKAMLSLAHELGMEALVEVRDREELEKAMALKPVIIGINNRNLKTMKVDIETTLKLLPEVSPETILVSESGLATHEDLVYLSSAGVRAFLIGTSLMRSPDRTKALKALIEGPDDTR